MNIRKLIPILLLVGSICQAQVIVGVKERNNSPVWSYPALTGKHKVGTVEMTLRDCGRQDNLSGSKECRRFAVRAYYPAKNVRGRDQLGFLEGYDLNKVAPFYEIHGVKTESFKNEVQGVKTHAFKEAPVASGKFPVITFSHGFGLAMSELHISFAQEMASHGYVVFMISHPYESMATKLSGSEYVYLNAERHQKLTNLVFSQAPEMMKLPALSSDSERKKLMKGVLANLGEMNKTHLNWVKDHQFLIDQLENWTSDRSSHWYRKVDLKRLGAIGHSLGGAVAGQLLMHDDRVTSAVNLDGLQMGDLVTRDVNKPIMMVSSKIYQGLNDSVFEGASGPVVLIHPADKFTNHNAYTDMALWPEAYFVNKTRDIGEIDGAEFLKMNNELILRFFDQTLNKRTLDLSEVLGRHDQLVQVKN